MNVTEEAWEARRQQAPALSVRDFAVFLACAVGAIVCWVYEL